MDLRAQLPGLEALQARTLGDPRVCVAVLDGPVDLDHPCFAGADLRRIATLAGGELGGGPMSLHGTHVTSLVFGQPGSPVVGLAPRCRGLIVPIFRDASDERASQLDLARAIEQALDEGADVISISGGERSPTGEAQAMLEHSLRRCAEDGVLVVAAVGNDGCDCLQVPAAAPSVLAVGACDAEGRPLPSNNWGEAFRANGVLAPGHRIEGAAPGGGRQAMTGSSFATPVVAATAALLQSARLAALGSPGRPVDTREAILASATPCPVPEDTADCGRYLVGRLDVGRAHEQFIQEGDPAVDSSEAAPTPQPLAQAPESEPSPVDAPDPHPASTGAELASSAAEPAGTWTDHAGAEPPDGPPTPPHSAPARQQPTRTARPAQVGGASNRSGLRAASSDCGCGGEPAGLIYAIGNIGYDFGTEARRDAFRQQMDRQVVPPRPGDPPDQGDYLAPPNPYAADQISTYLARNPWVSDKLIWTLNLDRTPIYALKAEAPVGMTWEGFNPLTAEQSEEGTDGDEEDPHARLVRDVAYPDRLATIIEGFTASPPVSYVYRIFRDAIVGQTLAFDDPDYISRVSVPGILTNKTVRLFSGQEVPLVEVKARGLHTWNEAALVNAAINEVEGSPAFREATADTTNRRNLERNVRAFLDKVYYQFRNLGQSAPDRALNYAGTNAFLITSDFRRGLVSGTYVPGEEQPLYSLDTITVSRSPYCRMDSDCWDVVVTFFDPANDRRARVSYLYTIDVSEELPVSLAPSHQFLGS